jgi:hypothetical protein
LLGCVRREGGGEGGVGAAAALTQGADGSCWGWRWRNLGLDGRGRGWKGMVLRDGMARLMCRRGVTSLAEVRVRNLRNMEKKG